MEACFCHKIESEKKMKFGLLFLNCGFISQNSDFFGILLFLNINWE